MSRIIYQIFVSMAAISMVACAQRQEIPEFDDETWRADKLACEGRRAEIAEELPMYKDKFLGMREDHVRELLGKPEQQELLDRNQKLYLYYYTPGSQCNDSLDIPGERIYFRFGAIQTVNEVNFKLD